MVGSCQPYRSSPSPIERLNSRLSSIPTSQHQTRRLGVRFGKGQFYVSMGTERSTCRLERKERLDVRTVLTGWHMHGSTEIQAMRYWTTFATILSSVHIQTVIASIGDA